MIHILLLVERESTNIGTNGDVKKPLVYENPDGVMGNSDVVPFCPFLSFSHHIRGFLAFILIPLPQQHVPVPDGIKSFSS